MTGPPWHLRFWLPSLLPCDLSGVSALCHSLTIGIISLLSPSLSCLGRDWGRMTTTFQHCREDLLQKWCFANFNFRPMRAVAMRRARGACGRAGACLWCGGRVCGRDERTEGCTHLLMGSAIYDLQLTPGESAIKLWLLLPSLLIIKWLCLEGFSPACDSGYTLLV